MKHSKGFTLIEVLLVLLCIPLIIELSIPLYSLMIRSNQNQYKQVDTFLLQFKQLLIRSNVEECYDDAIYISLENNSYTIELDDHRLIKRPGYEILLENVDDVMFTWGKELKIEITIEEEIYSFVLPKREPYGIHISFHELISHMV